VIVFSVGQQRSASSYCMDMTKALMLKSRKTINKGRNRYLAPYAFGKTFFVSGKNGELDTILAEYDGEFDLLLKTHMKPSPAIIEALNDGKLKATVTYRQPQDAVLSILEVAGRDRKRGTDRGFSHIETIEQAINSVRGHVRNISQWLELDHVLKLSYDETTASSEKLAHRINDYLELGLEPQVLKRVSRRIDSETGHEFNVGQSGRWKTVLSQEEQRAVIEAFGEPAN
jgi:hypothetical protein